MTKTRAEYLHLPASGRLLPRGLFFSTRPISWKPNFIQVDLKKNLIQIISSSEEPGRKKKNNNKTMQNLREDLEKLLCTNQKSCLESVRLFSTQTGKREFLSLQQKFLTWYKQNVMLICIFSSKKIHSFHHILKAFYSPEKNKRLKTIGLRNSLAVQRLGLCTFIAEGQGQSLVGN